ncbi:hypothetical protein CEV31_3618 [Brucella thiophenivorans]|uniref:Uncharacterized protein n=1 Tax=Brucella thiophenivorans TaxID=571255 RepID=A0A256FBL8_9HYPH|nr:hypothetical protein CEV31_3618 [Brucella thiophenivorans]
MDLPIQKSSDGTACVILSLVFSTICEMIKLRKIVTPISISCSPISTPVEWGFSFLNSPL